MGKPNTMNSNIDPPNLTPILNSNEDIKAILLLPPPPPPNPLVRTCGMCSCCCDTKDQGYCKTFGGRIKKPEEFLKLLNQ